MKRDPRAAAAGAATGGGLSSSSEAQQQSKDRGYVVNRNEKLHLLARQKRTSASDNALVDRQPAAAGRSSSTIGRSSTFPNRPRAVRLSAVLQQAPQHFDRVKVRDCTCITSHMLHSSSRQASHQDNVNTCRVSLATMPHLLHTCTLACMHSHGRDHIL